MVVSQTDGTWQQAEKVALPPGNEYPYLTSVSCSSAGNCAAVGQIDINSESDGLVVSQHNGVLGTAQEVTGPVGSQWTWLTSVSCAADGACSAVGGYEDSSGDTHPLALSESGGTWGSAVAIGVPGSPSESAFSQVDCPAAGACVALGSVEGYKPIVAIQSAGAWSDAEKLPEPAGATGLGFTASDISCGGVDSCVVGGSYNEGSVARPATVAESGGTWGSVTPLALPTDTASNNTHSELAAVSCPGENNCTAVGNYVSDTEAERAFSAREIAGVWQQAEQVFVPVPPEPEFPYALGWSGLDCVTAESCGATGYAFFHQTIGLMEGGSWAPGASPITLPSNAQSQEAGALESISCGGVGSCAAVGSYTDGEGMERAMALSTEVGEETSGGGGGPGGGAGEGASPPAGNQPSLAPTPVKPSNVARKNAAKKRAKARKRALKKCRKLNGKSKKRCIEKAKGIGRGKKPKAAQRPMLVTATESSCVKAGLARPKLLEAWVRHPGDRKTQSIFAEADWLALPDECDAAVKRVPSVRFQLQSPTNHARWINVGGFVRPYRDSREAKEELEAEREAEGKSCWETTEAGKTFVCDVVLWVTNKGGEGTAYAPKSPGWPDPVPSLERYRYRCTPGPGKTHARALIKNVVRDASSGEIAAQAIYPVPVRIKSYPRPPHPGHPKRAALQGPC